MTTYQVLTLMLLTPIALLCACTLGVVALGLYCYWTGR